MTERAARAFALVGLALALSGCPGGRRVDLEFHTPTACIAGPTDGSDGGADALPACPLASVVSLRTVVQRVDGTRAAGQCVVAPDGMCTLRDLEGIQLLDRVDSSDGVEILITGYADADCRGARVVSCESFGESVIALAGTTTVELWCDCPVLPGPPAP